MTSPRKTRRRRWPFAVIALLLGGALALWLAEVVLQKFDPIGLNYQKEVNGFAATAVQFAWEGKSPDQVDLDGHLMRLRPGVDVDIGSFRVRSNRLGLRGPDIEETKPPGTFRVLLLGDSVAFGWGVDEEVTFARRLETEWNAADPRVRLEVVNTGFPLYDTVQELATLREFLPRLRPDLVVLVYVVNDVEPTRDMVEGMLFGKQPDPAEAIVLPHDFWSWIGETMTPFVPALGQLLAAQTNLQRRVARLGGPPYAPETSGKGPRGWVRSQAALREIRDLCAGASVPLIAFDNTLPPIESLPPFCAREGIALVPLRFSDADHAIGICNSILDSHANAKGHELLLHRMRAALLERGLLPR